MDPQRDLETARALTRLIADVVINQRPFAPNGRSPILRSYRVCLPTRLRCTGSRASCTIEYELRGQGDVDHVRKVRAPLGHVVIMA